MYFIAVYDIGEKRVGKMLKLFRKYLNWVQMSVFEGELTDAQLEELKVHARKIMNEEEDSIIIYKIRDEKWMERTQVGKATDLTTNIF